jgi:hypothetical protein
VQAHIAQAKTRTESAVVTSTVSLPIGDSLQYFVFWVASEVCKARLLFAYFLPCGKVSVLIEFTPSLDDQAARYQQ